VALANEREGHTLAAISALRAAIRLDPDHLPALARLADLRGARGARAEAMALRRRVAALAPDSLAGRLCRAKVLIEDGRPDDAETVLRQAIALFPSSGEAKRQLTRILRQQGRFAEAITWLSAMTAGAPAEAAAAFHELAACRVMTSEDVPLVDRMRALLETGVLPVPYRARLGFALGKALDDLGDYEQAMHHFDAANRMTKPRERLDRPRLASSVRRLVEGCTAGFFDAHAGVGSPSDRPLLIVGMPRSGTTLVEQILSSHPGVASGGELTFWNVRAMALAHETRTVLPADVVAQIAADYETELYRVDASAARVTDKAPGNFLWIGLIRVVFPDVRIIHCRRHPVDTCLSTYFTSFAEPVPFAYDKADLVFYYQQYALLMRHWRSMLPDDRLHEIDYERLVAEPETVTRDLIAFCGLEWDSACLRPEANQRPVKTASSWQVRQRVFRGSVARWRHYEPWLGELRALLEEPAEAR
jgi:tetratricopeptide (TPR) repeat protein